MKETLIRKDENGRSCLERRINNLRGHFERGHGFSRAARGIIIRALAPDDAIRGFQPCYAGVPAGVLGCGYAALRGSEDSRTGLKRTLGRAGAADHRENPRRASIGGLLVGRNRSTKLCVERQAERLTNGASTFLFLFL
jgi:hypothetical protein